MAFDGDNDEDRMRPLRPTVAGEDDFPDSEELYPAEPYNMKTLDWILLVSRCGILLFFLVSYILVFVNVGRGTRLKNWRLYCLVALTLFCWLALSLYQDHIDEYFVHAVYRHPQNRSIYWCFRNLVHGLTLYLIILLLAHLSDFQHRGVWLFVVAAVVLAPILYSVALLVVDLRLHPDARKTWEWNVAIATVRIFLYNFCTTILLFVFSPRFCTSLLYGTYEEYRSSLVVLVSRWTFCFLLLHNLTAMASYGAYVAGKVASEANPELTSLIQRALDECAFLLVVLAVPVSYLAGVCGQCCCGGGAAVVGEVEMDKMDKIYQEVWTSNADRKSKTRNNAPPPNEVSAAPNGNNKTTVVATRPDGKSSSAITAAEKRKKRESYMEAVSMGSLQDINRPGSAASKTSMGGVVSDRPGGGPSSETPAAKKLSAKPSGGSSSSPAAAVVVSPPTAAAERPASAASDTHSESLTSEPVDL